MDASKMQTTTKRMANRKKDRTNLSTVSGQGADSTAKEGGKIVSPRSATTLGGQYRAVVRVQR